MKAKTILLVEDDYLDVMSVRRALAKLHIEHKLHVVHNGTDALALLNGSENGEKLLPDIILLDINMPKMNGLELLRIVKNYYSLSSIKVFVMTTSAEEYDKIAAESMGIAGYILKPLQFSSDSSHTMDEHTFALKMALMN